MNINKFFRSLPIRRKLAIAFAVLATAPLVVTGLIGTVVTIRYMEASASAALAHDLQVTREQTERFFRGAQEDVRYLSSSIFRPAVEGWVDSATLDSAVAAFLRAKPSFVQIKLFDAAGEAVIVRRSGERAPLQAEAGSGGVFYLYQARSLRPGDSSIVPAEILGSGDADVRVVAIPIIAILQPLHDVSGSIRAVAVGEVYASALFQELESGLPQLAGITGLVSRDGSHLYHTTKKSDWTSLLAAGPRFNLETEFGTEVSKEIVSGRDGSIKLVDDRLISFAPLSLSGLEGSELFLYRSVSSFVINRPVRRFLLGVGVGGLSALSLALVLAMVAATQLTRPIYRLREGARKVASGDFKQDLRIETNDELEELANDFMEMAARLREHTDHLEELVEERSAALRSAHAELEEILANSEDGIIRLDIEGRIRVWNRGAEKLFGYSHEEVIGQIARQLLVPPGRESRRELALIERELRQRGSIVDHHTRRIRKDNTPVEVSLSQSIIRDDAGAPLGCVLIIRDVTRHRELERRMIRSERLAAAGKLAAGIAHEVNNPIGIVLNRLECIELDLSERDPDSFVRSDLQVIREQTERVGDVARRLLSLSRDEPDTREPVNVNDIALRVIDFLKPTLQKKSLSVQWDLAEDLPSVSASRHGLEIVILNLMLNSIDASREGGCISIRTRSVDGVYGIELDVDDTGCGIDAELVERVFEPFFTTKEGARGTGLGLAVVRSVVQAHGGTVEVDSQQNVGSCFTIRLPLRAERKQWKPVMY